MPSFTSTYEQKSQYDDEHGFGSYDKMQKEKREADAQYRDPFTGGWIVDMKDALSYAYIFGADMGGKGLHNGMVWEDRPSDEMSRITRDYLSEHVSPEEQERHRDNYKRIMRANPKNSDGTDNWKVKALQTTLKNHKEMAQFGQLNKISHIAAVDKDRKAKEQANKKCSAGDWFTPWKIPGCVKNDIIEGEFVQGVFQKIGEGLSAVTDVVMEIPVLGDALEFASDNYERIKDTVDDVGQAIKNSGAVGEWIYNAGDDLHEAALKTGVFTQDIVEGLTGKDIEDVSLFDTGEIVAGTVSGGAGFALLGNDLIQGRKEQQRLTAMEDAIEGEYGDKPVEAENREKAEKPQTTSGPPIRPTATQPPIRPTADMASAQGPSEAAPQSTGGRQKAPKPTGGSGGGVCRPRRKPIKCPS